MVVPEKMAYESVQQNEGAVRVVEITLEDFLALVASQPDKHFIPAILNEQTG